MNAFFQVLWAIRLIPLFFFFSLIASINWLKIYPLFYLGLLSGSVFTCLFPIPFTVTTSSAKIFFLLIVCYWSIYTIPVFGKYFGWLGKYIPEFPRGMRLLGIYDPTSSWYLGAELWQYHVGQLSLHHCQVCSSMKDILWRYKSEIQALHAAYSRTELRLQTSKFIQCSQSHHLADTYESLRESLFI